MSPDVLYKEIGRRIFKARIAKGLSQEQLASKTSLKRTSITNIENGKQKLLVHTLIEIARGLEVELESLIPKVKAPTNNQIVNRYPESSGWIEAAVSSVEEK